MNAEITWEVHVVYRDGQTFTLSPPDSQTSTLSAVDALATAIRSLLPKDTDALGAKLPSIPSGGSNSDLENSYKDFSVVLDAWNQPTATATPKLRSGQYKLQTGVSSRQNSIIVENGAWTTTDAVLGNSYPVRLTSGDVLPNWYIQIEATC